jgi:hypothetical protein
MVLLLLALIPTAAATSFPLPALMTVVQRQQQAAARTPNCGSSAVIDASCFGFDPTDSTEFLQAALDAAANYRGAPQRKVVVPSMCNDSSASAHRYGMDNAWVTRPLVLRSNTTLELAVGVQLWAKRGAYHGNGDSVLTVTDEQNVHIRGYGASITMHKADYADPAMNYTASEYRAAIRLFSVVHFSIAGLLLRRSGGDGIGVYGQQHFFPNGTFDPGRPSFSRDVHIKDVVCSDNYRTGLALTGAVDVLVEDSVFELTTGTPPMAGVDIEPDTSGNHIRNVTFRGCVSRSNYEQGFNLSPSQSTVAPVTVTFLSCESVGDRLGAWAISSNPGIRGMVRLEGCTVRGGAGPGLFLGAKSAAGLRLEVVNTTLVDTAAHQWSDSGGAGEELRFPVSITPADPHSDAANKLAGPLGGVHFRGLRVVDTLSDVLRGPHDASSARAWLNATSPFGLLAVTGDVMVVNTHGCSEIVQVREGAPKQVLLKTTCEAPL